MDQEYTVIMPAQEIGLVEETHDFSIINDAEHEAYQRWHIQSNQ